MHQPPTFNVLLSILLKNFSIFSFSQWLMLEKKMKIVYRDFIIFYYKVELNLKCCAVIWVLSS